MAKIRRIVKSLELDQDGIFDEAITGTIHEEPHPIHYDRAAEVCGFEDSAQVPRFASVAELISFVLSVRAAGGDDKAINALLDRFTPKAARTAAEQNDGRATAQPVASTTPEEQAASENYREKLLSH